jgi:hypothetical protein
MAMMVRSVAPSASGKALSSAIMMPTSSVQSWATSPMQLRLFNASVQNGFLIRAASKKKRVMKVPTVSCDGDPALMNTNNVVIRNLRCALSESLRAAFRTRTQQIAIFVSNFFCVLVGTYLRAISIPSHHQKSVRSARSKACKRQLTHIPGVHTEKQVYTEKQLHTEKQVISANTLDPRHLVGAAQASQAMKRKPKRSMIC